jgi:hypothetical protein
MRGIAALALLVAGGSLALAAKPVFVFEERAGRTYTEGAAHWRDALLRASVGGCKERLPRGSRLRPGIRDCVVNQVHVTNLSAVALVCDVTLVFSAPDDDGRSRIGQTIHVEPHKERWVATAYGPASLVPREFASRCQSAASNTMRARAWDSTATPFSLRGS